MNRFLLPASVRFKLKGKCAPLVTYCDVHVIHLSLDC